MLFAFDGKTREKEILEVCNRESERKRDDADIYNSGGPKCLPAPTACFVYHNLGLSKGRCGG